MNEQEKCEGLVHDIIYDFLILMSDESIFGETEYDKGYIDGIFEAYKIIQDKLSLFGITHIPAISKMPDAEDWHRNGRKSIHLP